LRRPPAAGARKSAFGGIPSRSRRPPQAGACHDATLKSAAERPMSV